ncbi:hypothetical protein KW786_03645 [Candidatus Parcubacteria bacterium]|nr:hypothetical protein [Candidatus Parcubacteria bacterium]
METRNVIISLIVGLLVLAAGFLGGMFWGGMGSPAEIVSPDSDQQPGTSQVVKDLSSKVIPSIAAYGKVSKIENRNLTLNYEGDTVIIPVRNDAKIYSFVSSASGTATKPNTVPSSKEITFQEVKMDDNVSVNVKVLENGTLEGFSVVVLPPPATPAPAPATK